MKENKYIENKEKVTSTFLKTVSAFANYGGGKIVFGVDDDGNIVGIDDMEEACAIIENKINTTIKPQPDYTISTNRTQRTVALMVNPGAHKPYLYNSKAYKRNDTSTIEVDDIEMRRLVMDGEHLTYEGQPTRDKKLSFNLLKNELKEQIGIKRFDQDLLKTLNLYGDEEGYNNAAAILSDINTFPGIDVARFGETISVIQKRVTIEHQSIINAYRETISIFRDYYEYDEVVGEKRKRVEIIPETAFREAIANAIIHREWDVNSNIRVSMFDDYVEIVSPGGLPSGISEGEYSEGRISVLRNPILANVFNRLNIVETFGTGVLRIKEAYEESVAKPIFDAGDNSIRIILPLLDDDINITDDERVIYGILSKTKAKPISEIMESEKIQFGKSKATVILQRLGDKKLVSIEGKGRGTKYRRR